MRREERVTVQGPVKEQQPDGMSHRGSEAQRKFVYLKDPQIAGPFNLIFRLRKTTSKTVVRSSAGAGAIYPPFWRSCTYHTPRNADARVSLERDDHRRPMTKQH